MEEQNEQTQELELATAIRASFDAGQENGQDEDQVKLSMISAGATFKNVTRLFNQFMVDAGLAIGKEEKEQVLAEVLADAELATEEAFNAKVAELVKRLTGATEKSAGAMVRAYAKKNEVEVFKKAKGASAGKQGFAGKFYAYLTANPTCSKDECIAFVQGTDGNEETSENVKRHQSHYLSIHAMVNKIAGVDQTEEEAVE